MNSFRSSAWTLREAHADEADTVRLEQQPIASDNADAVLGYRITADEHATLRPWARAKALLEHGFRYLGTTTSGAGGIGGLVYDVFVDADETTHVEVRRFLRPDALLAPRYQIGTLFADGTYIETGPSKAGSKSRSLVGRTGSGDLVRDAIEHVATVRDRASRGRRVVRIATLSDVMRLHVFYMGHVLDPEGARAVADLGKNVRALFGGTRNIVSIVLFAVLLYALVCHR